MDAAFNAGAYPAYTTAQLEAALAEGRIPEVAERMRAELDRRARVAAGDVSAMTPGERLRHVRQQEGR